MVDPDIDAIANMEAAIDTPDAVHATRIKDLTHELEKAVNAAANAGLDVDIDAHSISRQSLGNSKPVPLWRIAATVARPL